MNAQPQTLLVIGGGMAGLSAAAFAAKSGAHVTVVDSAKQPGGSGRFAGYMWTAPTREVMRAENPNGNEALGNALVDRFQDGLDWVRSVGVELGAAQRILPFGQGHKMDTNQYLDNCLAIVDESGGRILTEAITEELLKHDGVVVGARVKLADGTIEEIYADNTLLATGGFQGDPDLITERIHPLATQMPIRSNPHSRGVGYRLATAAGAATTFANAGFYGHLIPSGVPFKDPSDFVELSLYFSEHCLLFNLNNERFTDETLGDHLTTMEILEQPEARGLLIADARVYRDWILASYVEGVPSIDRFAIVNRRGGRTGVAQTLEELAYLPEEWGYDGEAIAAAIAEFNEKTKSNSAQPGRKLDPAPLEEPPYYVIEAIPAITFTFEGIQIDEHARVLNDSGEVIPGLLAAGSDTGGIWNRAYAGGVASAVVFGLTAARTALN